MDAPPAESRTFLHRVLRWMAILALAYGLLQSVTLIAFAATDGFPFDRYYSRSDSLALGFSVLMVLSAVLVLVGGWGLVRWRSWGRVVLIVWSMLGILLGLAQAIASVHFFVREFAGTTQPAFRPHIGLVVWSSLHHWLTGCTLPVVFLATLLQPEVAKLWAGPRGGGGFDVIPMATAAAPTEVVR